MKKVALVTGAATGIGSEVARQLSEDWNLALHTRKNEQSLSKTAELCQTFGADTLLTYRDFSQLDQVDESCKKLIDEVVLKFDRIDALVINAGYAKIFDINSFCTQDLLTAYSTITGQFLALIKHAMPYLKKSRDARIIFVSSFTTKKANNQCGNFTLTAAAKSAAQSLISSLALEHIKNNITINAVLPGFIQKDEAAKSAMTHEQWAEIIEEIPAKRLGLPLDVARVVKFLIDEKSSYITGQLISVDGGISL
ncbi:SDR family NAD(P)-dependent oxidoreductase [Aliikangiella maris]|uniref:SDR family oxidoreductase n=2 Tax=Aliikangiella maris TaxID=3162458 RepID=A0ABV3MT17_9GAMM